MAFADNLAQLPPIAHLAELQLLDAAGNVVANIENKPGKAGSLAVYAALAAKHGCIDATAAEEGLRLFAEHTEAARATPGSHPNIDKLFETIAANSTLRVKLISR